MTDCDCVVEDFDCVLEDCDGDGTDFDRVAADYDCVVADFDHDATDFDRDVTDSNLVVTDSNHVVTDSGLDVTRNADRAVTHYPADVLDSRFDVRAMTAAVPTDVPVGALPVAESDSPLTGAVRISTSGVKIRW